MRLLRCHGAGARIPAPPITQTSEEMRESIAQMRETGALLRKQKNTNKTRERCFMPFGGSCSVSSARPLSRPSRTRTCGDAALMERLPALN